LEDIPSSFVGARFCTLDDSALKTSRHCYLKSCWNTGLQGEAGPKRRVLDHEGLSHWHSMLMAGNRYIETVGAYRTRQDAMRIVSGRLARPNIHLELPRLAGLPLRWSASPHGSTNPAPMAKRRFERRHAPPSISFSLKAYIHLRMATAKLAARSLQQLVEIGALTRMGKRWHSR